MDKWLELYDWLGFNLALSLEAAKDEESTAMRLLDEAEGEALQKVRQHMRRLDPSLPVKEADEW